MPPVLRNILRSILALVLGLVAGSLVNWALLQLGSLLISNPEGLDTSSEDGLKATLHLLRPQHLLFPFLGHALGTFAGAGIGVMLATWQRSLHGLVISCLFLLGGIANYFIIPSPQWFVFTDLLLAYLPMGWLAGRLLGRRR